MFKRFLWVGSVVFAVLNLYHYPVRFLIVVAVLLCPVAVGYAVGRYLTRKRILERLDDEFHDLSTDSNFPLFSRDYEIYTRLKNAIER